MSSLRSALDELLAEDVRRLDDQTLEADFDELQRAAAVVEAAKRLPAPQLHHTVSHWRRSLDWSQGLKDAERLRDRRRLSLSTTVFGSVRVDGDLDPETGETVLAALRGCQDADRRRRDPD